MPKNESPKGRSGQNVYARLAKICPTNEVIGDANRAKAKEYSETLKSDVDNKDKLIGKRKYERTKRVSKKNEEEKQDLPETKNTTETKEVEEKPARKREDSEGVRRRAPRRKKQEAE